MTTLAQAWEQATRDVQENLRADLPYEWKQPPGVRAYKPFCKADQRFYGWMLEVNKDYPRTPVRGMRPGHPHLVVFNGALVQTWKCGGCGHKVVK